MTENTKSCIMSCEIRVHYEGAPTMRAAKGLHTTAYDLLQMQRQHTFAYRAVPMLIRAPYLAN